LTGPKPSKSEPGWRSFFVLSTIGQVIVLRPGETFPLGNLSQQALGFVLVHCRSDAKGAGVVLVSAAPVVFAGQGEYPATVFLDEVDPGRFAAAFADEAVT
jgi:hypothetical protein